MNFSSGFATLSFGTISDGSLGTGSGEINQTAGVVNTGNLQIGQNVSLAYALIRWRAER